MKIKEIVSQSRRDFTAVYECEHCGHEYKGSGYDDTNFHKNVVPNKKCPECGQVSPDSFRPLATRHDDSVVV